LTTHLSTLHPAQSVTIAAVAQIHLSEHLHRCWRRASSAASMTAWPSSQMASRACGVLRRTTASENLKCWH
jgi:hypothetical protein